MTPVSSPSSPPSSLPTASMASTVSTVSTSSPPGSFSLGARWHVECWRDGHLVWTEEYTNLVVTEGRNTVLDRTFKTIPADVNWYVGLKGSGTVAASDTMASHPGWAEITPYSNATRPQFVPGSVAGGSVDNSASPASFSINVNTTAYGAFLTTDSTKAGTTGLLFGAGDFAQARSLLAGDVLSVTVTLTAAAA